MTHSTLQDPTPHLDASLRQGWGLLPVVLARPALAADLSRAEWCDLIRQARACRMLGRTLGLAADACERERLPSRAQEWLTGEERVARHQRQCLHYEIGELSRVLAAVGHSLVLLKGAAYAAHALPFAMHRKFTDIDLLVARARLPDVEHQLRSQGWTSDKRSRYDDRYYREWMHELPPMHHAERGTALDLHHDIVPPIGRLPASGEDLLDNAIPVAGCTNTFTLSGIDMIIHSAVHLMAETEYDKALRDLHDLWSLAQLQAREGRLHRLPLRAQQLGYGGMVADALDLSQWLYGALPPLSMVRDSSALNPVVLRAMRRLLGDQLRTTNLLDQSIVRTQGRTQRLGNAAARLAVLCNGHWLKMPLWRLASHSAHKLLTPAVP